MLEEIQRAGVNLYKNTGTLLLHICIAAQVS